MVDSRRGGEGPEGTSESTLGVPVSPKPPGKSRIIIICLIVLVLFGVGWLVHVRKSEAGKKQAAGGRGAANAGPVPVVAGTVARKDVPIYLDGLGTVQAFNTVTVHSRVDGQLQKVAFSEGQDVRAGDLLAQIDPAPFKALLAEVQAKKGQDEAQLANARVQLDRDTDLLKQQIIAQQDYDTQKTLTAQLEAAVKADQAAIESAQVQLNYTTIGSPIDGRTGLRQVDPGNIVKATDTNGIVVLTQLRPISIIFTVPEQNLAAIQKQMAQDTLAVLAVDRDNRTILSQGKVVVLDNQLDTTTATIRLKATFPNEDLRLWPGQFVNTRLLLMVRKNATVVPASVIQRGAEGPFAFVIKDESAQVRPVKVAQIESGQALVEEGLQPGEQVVVDGQYKLQNGSKVRISTGEAAASPPSGSAPATNNPAKGKRHKT
jgi:multidrug efflux system membrane fusion protein